MKKFLVFCLASMLASCAQYTNEGTGLVRVNQEPENCEFLYSIKSDFSGYSEQDAFDFVEKRIVEENGFGDTYYIEKQDIAENIGAIFGPKHTYKIRAKVYNCKK